MRNILVLLLLLIASMAITGCASLSSSANNRYDISSLDIALQPATPVFKMIDKRPAVETSVNDELAATIPESSFTPKLTELLFRRLAAEKIALLQDAEVVILEAKTRAILLRSNAMPARPVMMIGAPLPALLIGNLVGLGLVKLLQPGDKIEFITRFEVEVKGQKYEVQGNALPSSGGVSSAKDSIESALKKLVVELQNGPRPLAAEAEPQPAPVSTSQPGDAGQATTPAPIVQTQTVPPTKPASPLPSTPPTTPPASQL